MANPLSRGSHMVDLRAVFILPRLETLLSHSHVVTGNVQTSGKSVAMPKGQTKRHN